MRYNVVVSYAREDRETAVTLCNQLVAEGLETKIAPRVTTLDQNFAGELMSLISSANVLVVVMSKHSVSSGQMLREIELAAKHNLTILPVRLDDVKSTGSLGYYLSGKRWFDMTRKEIKPWQTASEISKYLTHGDEAASEDGKKEKRRWGLFRSKRK
jgi:hypothetical protein